MKTLETVTFNANGETYTINADDYKNGIKGNKAINALIAKSKTVKYKKVKQK